MLTLFVELLEQIHTVCVIVSKIADSVEHTKALRFCLGRISYATLQFNSELADQEIPHTALDCEPDTDEREC